MIKSSLQLLTNFYTIKLLHELSIFYPLFFSQIQKFDKIQASISMNYSKIYQIKQIYNNQQLILQMGCFTSSGTSHSNGSKPTIKQQKHDDPIISVDKGLSYQMNVSLHLYDIHDKLNNEQQIQKPKNDIIDCHIISEDIHLQLQNENVEINPIDFTQRTQQQTIKQKQQKQYRQKKVIRPPVVIEEFINNINQINKTDAELSQLLIAIITLIRTQPALSCLIRGQYIIDILSPFNKGYVNQSTGGSIIELVLAIIQDSILFVNDGRLTKSKYITGDFIGVNQYIKKIVIKIHKIEQQTYFINRDTLKMLDYVFENGKNKCNKECYQHLTFDFSDEEVKKVGKDVKKLCRFNMKAFAFLSNYLLQCCYIMEKNDKSVTVQMIIKKLNEAINVLKKEHPPAIQIKFQKQFVNEHKNYKYNQLYTPKQFINLKKIPSNKRVEALNKFIQERVNESHSNYPIFLQIVKDISIKEGGYHFKSGMKLSNMKNKKAVNRIKEKMLSVEFKKYNLTPNFKNNINLFFAEQYNNYEKEMEQMYDRIETDIQFGVSDMIRGKCMFPQIQNINSCASAILKKIKKLEKEKGMNCHLVEIKNRLEKNTCDLMLKIQINESICEFQLTSDKVNVVANQFNHKLYEISRSLFFTSLSMLKLFNEEISNDYFGQIFRIIEANTKSKINRDYGQKITFKQANSFISKFIDSLPTKISQYQNSFDSNSIAKYYQQLNKIKNQKIKTQNIEERIKDVPFRNGNLKYQLKQYELAEQELQKYTLCLKQDQFSLFKKIENQAWNQITQEEKDVANKYQQAAFILGQINDYNGKYQQAIRLLEENNIILSQHVLDHKIGYAANLSQLGQVYKSQGKYRKAIQYYEKCLKIEEMIYGIGCIDSATTLNNIGQAYYNQGIYKKAIQYYEKCLGIQEKMKGIECIESAGTLNNIGMVYNSQGIYSKAIQYYERSLEIQERAKGIGCIDSAGTLNNIGGVYDSQGIYNKAIQYYERCLEIKEKVNGIGCIDSATTLNNIASAFQSMNDFSKAVQYYQRAIKIEEDKNIKYQNYADHNWNLGLCFMNKLQDKTSAIPCFLKAELIYSKLLHQQQIYKQCLEQLLICYQEIGNDSKANQYQQKLSNII